MASSHFDRAAEEKALVKSLAASFNSDGSAGDITVRFNGTDVKCHKYILCSRSEWFRKAITGEFKEGKSAVIELHEEGDTQAVHAMLEFLYTIDYTTPQDIENQALFHIRMFALGEKYFIPALPRLATDRFVEAANKRRDDDRLSEAIIEAYKTTSDSAKILRPAIVDTLMKLPEGFEDEEGNSIDTLLETLPELAAQIARASAKWWPSTAKPKKYRCPLNNCSRMFTAVVPKTGTYTYNCPNAGTGTHFYNGASYTYTATEWKKYLINIT